MGENLNFAPSLLALVPGTIAALAILMERKRSVEIFLGSAIFLAAAHVLTNIVTNDPSYLGASMAGIALATVSAGFKTRRSH